MKKVLFVIILGFFALGFKANAQSSPVPGNYVLKAKEDYAKYNEDIIKTIDWLQQTPGARNLNGKRPMHF